MSSGNKYHREIKGVDAPPSTCTVDVYSVLAAFNVTCPARQHAIKKLLCAGLRNKGSASQDLTEARDAISRAIEMVEPGKEQRDYLKPQPTQRLLNVNPGELSAANEEAVPLGEVVDADRLHCLIEYLYDVIDDIETLSDIFRDDRHYRVAVEQELVKWGKGEVRSLDGMTLVVFDKQTGEYNEP